MCLSCEKLKYKVSKCSKCGREVCTNCLTKGKFEEGVNKNVILCPGCIISQERRKTLSPGVKKNTE